MLARNPRNLIDAGDFASLCALDAGLYRNINVIGAAELKQLLAYIHAHVPLAPFTKVA